MGILFRRTAGFAILGGLALVVGCGGDGKTGATGPAGPTGPAGAKGMVATSAEPPGANCPNGGTKVQFGLDTDANGVLDPSEVSTTSYVCDGNGGKISLVKTSTEPAGGNCPFGGVRIETGVDGNGNGVLDPDEVNAAATNYVCDVAPGGTISPSSGIAVSINPGDVSTSTTGPITVRFVLRDDRGFPLDLAGKYSQNTPIQPRFSLAYFTKDERGMVSPLTVYTRSGATPQPTSYNPLGTAAGNGTLVENGYGAGSYTYSFPTQTTANGGAVAIAYDATKLNETHVVWIQVSRQTDEVYVDNANTFDSANQSFYFIPSGAGTPLKREVVAQSGCDSCHQKFKAETTASAAFHGGGRVNATYCNVCHNPGRTSNASANSATFIHRIHNGEDVATANLFHGIAATYPQDIRNCDTCHKGAAQGAQAQSNPTRAACTGCHDNVVFDGSNAVTCTNPPTRGSDGKRIPCNHHVSGVLVDDKACAICHTPDVITAAHKPVAVPDPNNSLLVPGGNANTNASYLAAVGYVPAGAAKISYDIKSVDAVADAAITPNKRPQITFKLKKDGVDVVFQTFSAGVVTELMPNFVGSPSVYFAFAVPQDGVAAPSDFNASVGGYIKKIWDGSATGTGAGTLTGPDGSGYYTIKLTGAQIPANATMVTGGVGYTYSLSSTPPLVQTDVPGYPLSTDGKNQGGVSVPAANVWKVATGYSGRRAIVDNAKCQSCHGTLGVSPTFHAGQRNNGPTCSFCHNPNRTSSGWSAGSKYYIHAIHAGRKRTVDFTWHATQAGPGYDEIEFPGTLNTCTTCHVPNTYDFTNASNLNAIPGMQLTTVATGKYDTNPLTNSTYYTVSPYVVADNVTDYGVGFSYNVGTAATVEAAGTTLVLSQITGACSACHDTTTAINHMKANGGLFYAPRSTALAQGGSKEQCMICHGPGRVAAIGEVHQR